MPKTNTRGAVMGTLADEAVYCVRYLRISPKPEENREVLAIDRQRDLCIVMEERYGWTCIGEYVDESVSATSKKPRKGYLAMLADLEAGKATAVSVAASDRLDRSPEEREPFIKLCERQKIQLACEMGLLDLTGAMAKFMFRSMGNNARLEMDMKAERQNNTHAQRVANPDGGLWFSVTPFGYQKVKAGVVKEHPRNGDVVREMYTKVLAGTSQHSIAQDLNARGIKSAKGAQWDGKRVRQLLLNPRNAGKRTYRGEIVSDGWPSLVSVETWQTARARLTSHPTNGVSRDSSARHLLSGIARCSLCGQKLYACPAAGGGPGYYRCLPCRKVNISLTRADETVTTVTLKRLSQPDAKEAFLFDKDAPDYARHQATIAEATELKNTYALMAARKEIDPPQLAILTAGLNDDIAEANRAIAAARSTSVLGPFLEDPYGLWPVYTLEQKRAVLREAMDITITPRLRPTNTFDPERIQIDWRAA